MNCQTQKDAAVLLGLISYTGKFKKVFYHCFPIVAIGASSFSTAFELAVEDFVAS
jgi:hypothetical protein